MTSFVPNLDIRAVCVINISIEMNSSAIIVPLSSIKDTRVGIMSYRQMLSCSEKRLISGVNGESHPAVIIRTAKVNIAYDLHETEHVHTSRPCDLHRKFAILVFLILSRGCVRKVAFYSSSFRPPAVRATRNTRREYKIRHEYRGMHVCDRD